GRAMRHVARTNRVAGHRHAWNQSSLVLARIGKQHRARHRSSRRASAIAIRRVCSRRMGRSRGGTDCERAREVMTPTSETPLKIVVVSAFYSDGMGYSENCLPKVLPSFGHDVHVITSTFNVSGNEPAYDDTYKEFLGPRQVPAGTSTVDGYRVHRLESDLLSGYVRIKGMSKRVAELSPDIVHSLEIASLQTFELAVRRPLARYRLFTETHQCMSVVRPYMRQSSGPPLKRAATRLTRTLPGNLASLAVESCYAVTPDCAEVAGRFYGVPDHKLKMQSLGTDTDLFLPVETEVDQQDRHAVRAS